MGIPAPEEFRRGYARPGELDPSILERKPSEPRPAVGLDEDRKSTAPPGVGLDRNRKSPAPPPAKNAINTKKVSARFELLPDQKPRWGRIGLSAAGQLAGVGLLLMSPLLFPQPMQTALKFEVVELMQPVTQIRVPPPIPPPPKIRPRIPPPEPKPVPPEPAELNPKQPHIFVVPKPNLPRFRTVDAKPVELNPVLKQTQIVVLTSQPARPKEDVKVGNLSLASPAFAKVVAPVIKASTGGFGDPNGIPGLGNPHRAASINQAGSPLLPGGPGHSNGSGGVRGHSGVAAGEPKKAFPAGGATTGVDILNMPNPAYSSEGRDLRIEGDVILEVVFLASGQVQVTHVVSGLGHGLDETAIHAAKQIRFRPAKHDGQPVDFPARVRIKFRLAG